MALSITQSTTLTLLPAHSAQVVENLMSCRFCSASRVLRICDTGAPRQVRQCLSLRRRRHDIQMRCLPGRQPSNEVRNRRHSVVGQDACSNCRAVAPSTLEYHGAVAGHGAELPLQLIEGEMVTTGDIFVGAFTRAADIKDQGWIGCTQRCG